MDNSYFDQFINHETFDDYVRFAKDNTLSKYNKIGFPDAYRKGKEEFIFKDVIQKLDFDFANGGQTFLDIGPGCGDLPLMIQKLCNRFGCKLLWADSKEMLDHLPDSENTIKFEGSFPNNLSDLINQYHSKVDYILCYSVIMCVYYDRSLYKFIDAAVSLLKPGGKLLIGDIANITKRKRFFSTETGIQFHKSFMNTNDAPIVKHWHLEPNKIDDGVIFGILQRYRNFGFETYLLPQNSKLPFYNRREDILICKI